MRRKEHKWVRNSKLILTTNAASLTKVDASNWGLAIWPSQAAKILRMDGRIPSFNARRSSGANKANVCSREGCDSIHSPRSGSVSFKELSSVNDDKNAIGMDQNKHNAVVAAKAASLPVLLELSAKPMFRQKIWFGSGAGSTIILLAASRQDKFNDKKE